jgi:histidinol-phosphate aminotransferase
MKKALLCVHRYPDGSQSRLRQSIAEVHELDPSKIVCGNGSEDLIGLLVRAYVAPGDELLLSENHFVMCRIYGLAQGADVVLAPERDFTVDVDALLERVGPRTRMVALANPNNPTGTCLRADEIRRLHANLPPSVILLLDGAYAEYVMETGFDAGAGLVEAFQNVVMTRTFSKIYGMAGLRVGWAYCPLSIIDAVQRIRTPFNTNAVAMAGAAAAVRDQTHIARVRQHTADWQRRIYRELQDMGLSVVPSTTNFYLIVFDGSEHRSAAGAAGALEAAGIAPRPANPSAAGYDALRITVGTDAENEAVLETLRAYMRA